MAEIYNVQFRYSWKGLVNMFTLNYSGPDNYVGAQDFSEILGSYVRANLPTAAFPSDFSLVQLYIKSRQTQGPGMLLTPSSWPYTGTNGSDNLGVTAVCNYTFSASPPQYPTRGLIQWPCVFESWQTFGAVQAAAFVDVTSFLAGLITYAVESSGGTYTPVLYSSKYDNSKPIESISIAERWTTNVRKLRGL